ncbi:MAG TPA: hypothetical protein VK348_09080 [Planctomycetota bacterium]|nr:hypothetical protein [Planctomycetota bacterium]
MESGVLVEFIGLPGVGKSELSGRIARVLAGNGVAVRQPSHALAHDLGPIMRRICKSLHVLRELVSHPVASTRAVRTIAATRQRSGLTFVLLVFNWLLVVTLARRARRRPGAQLFDQGVVQALWSVALDGDPDAAMLLLRQAAASRVLPDIVIVVEAELATVHQRLLSRADGNSRADREPDRVPELLARGSELLQRIRKALLASPEPRILTLCNEVGADLDHAVGDVADLVRRRAAGAERT